MPARSFALSATLILATIIAGLTLRFAHLGLPQTIIKYGGSALWAMMIYWLVSTLLPRSIPSAAIAAAILATAVEFFKLVQTPTLEAFRLTLPGILLLGRFFSLWDIVAYSVAIGVAALADTILRNHLAEASSLLTRSSPR